MFFFLGLNFQFPSPEKRIFTTEQMRTSFYRSVWLLHLSWQWPSESLTTNTIIFFLLFTINYKTAIYWHVYLIVSVVSDPDFDTQPRFVTLSTNYTPCGFHYRLQIIHGLLWPSVSKSIGVFWLSYL